MSRKVYVAGVGMIPFKKPGASETYDVMGEIAIRDALADAGLDFKAIQQAYAGYVYGDSTCGQKALYRVGMTGIPVINVNNNCATGSSALWLARQAVESGAVDCALAFGFEFMQPGPLLPKWPDRAATLSTYFRSALPSSSGGVPTAMNTICPCSMPGAGSVVKSSWPLAWLRLTIGSSPGS